MKRGELYRVLYPPGDRRSNRVFVVVSRDGFLQTSHSMVMCAPVYSAYHGLKTEVQISETDGMKRLSAIQCDHVTSLQRSRLTNFVGSLSQAKLREVNRALLVALALEGTEEGDPL